MTEQESKDLEKLKADMLTVKVNFYSMCQSLNRADARQLETMGCRNMSSGDAMQHFFKSYERDLKKLQDTHVKKYPD